MTFAKLWVGDVTKGGLGAVRADAIYTDPPWNPGIARIMRQWADADEGPIDFERFTRVSAMAIAKAGEMPEATPFARDGSIHRDQHEYSANLVVTLRRRNIPF